MDAPPAELPGERVETPATAPPEPRTHQPLQRSAHAAADFGQLLARESSIPLSSEEYIPPFSGELEGSCVYDGGIWPMSDVGATQPDPNAEASPPPVPTCLEELEPVEGDPALEEEF